MAGLADKPQGYFIVPVEGATGEGNVLRVSGELGPYPGSVVPQAGNRGRLLPLQSGDLDDDTQPRRVYVLESGGADGGTGTEYSTSRKVTTMGVKGSADSCSAISPASAASALALPVSRDGLREVTLPAAPSATALLAREISESL